MRIPLIGCGFRGRRCVLGLARLCGLGVRGIGPLTVCDTGRVDKPVAGVVWP